MAGTANAIAGTARFGIGSLAGFLLSGFEIQSERPMLYAMALCTTLSFAAYYFLSCKASKQ